VDKLKILVLHPKEWAFIESSLADVRHVSIGGSTPRRLNGSLTEDGIGDVATEKGIMDLYSMVSMFQPDILLFGIHFKLERLIINRVKEMCPSMKVVMHYTDQREGIPNEVGQYVGALDLLLVTNQDEKDHQKYLNVGVPVVDTFYDGINPDVYWPKAVEAKHDCFFGGNDHYGLYQSIKSSGRKPPEVLNFSRGKFRHDFLLAVSQQFDLLVRGRLGWDDTLFNVKPMLFQPRYLDALLEGKIILGTVVAPRYKLYMRRLFRSIATGRMLLMEYVEGMEDDFENHKHFVWFKTIEEGIDLIKYYLDHEKEREEIGWNGRSLILNKHTCEHRLIEFCQITKRVFQ